MDAYFITGNSGKLAEIQRVSGYEVNHVQLELDEIQELDEKKIIEHKAKQAWEKIRKPVIVWDSSVYINCLNGFPGPLIRWFWQKVTLEKICRLAAEFDDFEIRARAILAYYDSFDIHYFQADEIGSISDKPKGDNGFGWDAIFIPQGSDQTYAQMSEEDPLFRSFNQKAILSLLTFLKQRSITLKR